MRSRGSFAALASLVSALGLSACVQTTNLSQPAAPLAGNPMLLTPDGATVADGAAASLPAPPDAVATPVVAAPAPVAAAPAPVKPAPVPVKAEPVPVVTTTAAPAEPVPVEAPAPAKAASGEYPNINVVPPQPGGTLLPVEERAKIIAELEALRAKQGGSAPKPATQTKALTDEAATHGADALKQIEKCSQAGAADLYPECAPED